MTRSGYCLPKQSEVPRNLAMSSKSTLVLPVFCHQLIEVFYSNLNFSRDHFELYDQLELTEEWQWFQECPDCLYPFHQSALKRWGRMNTTDNVGTFVSTFQKELPGYFHPILPLSPLCILPPSAEDKNSTHSTWEWGFWGEQEPISNVSYLKHIITKYVTAGFY